MNSSKRQAIRRGLAFFLACRYAGAQPFEAAEKIEKQVITALASGVPIEIIIRLATTDAAKETEKQSSEIYANSSLAETEKTVLNTRAYEQYEAQNRLVEQSIFSTGRHAGIEVIGRVSFGRDVIAKVRSKDAVLLLATEPQIERIFLVQKTYMN